MKIDFTGTLESGKAFATTKNKEPVELEIGSNSSFEKLEQAIVGMQAGDTKSIEIQPEDGFGQHDGSLVMTVNKESIPKEIALQVGVKVRAKQPNGRIVNLTVTEMDDTTVTLDANHPLAGETLFFDIEVLEIV